MPASGDFSRAFIAFLAIVDPIGNVLVFYLLTQCLPAGQRVRVAVVAVAAAYALLAVFSVGGREVLAYLGISSGSFNVAAGLLLLLPAYRLVERGEPMDVADRDNVGPAPVALVPLATPLMAGPGALATAISFAESLGTLTTLAAAGLVLVLSLAGFLAAAWLFEHLGPSLLRLLSRLVGIVLFAIAIELVLSGLRLFFGWG